MHIAPSAPDLPDASRFACEQVCQHNKPAQKCKDQPNRPARQGDLQRLKNTAKKEDSALPTVTRVAQFTDLPYEMVRHIASRLEVRSISALSQSCRHLNSAVQGLVIDAMASHYYGLPDSKSYRQYDRLCQPLAKRLLPATEPDHHRQQHSPDAPEALPLAGYQQQWPCQITRLRILSHNRHLQPACEMTEQNGKFKPLTCGFGKEWGEYAVLKDYSALFCDQPEFACNNLKIASLNPALSLITIPDVEPLRSHDVRRARVLADDHIVMEGSVLPNRRAGQDRHVLTVCRPSPGGDATHALLPGEHSDNIVQFEALTDGRLVSASLDGTLKIRPLSGSCEGLPQVVTLSNNHTPITAMMLFADGRCITSALDYSLTIWDLSRPAEVSLVVTLTNNTVRCFVQLHLLTENRFVCNSSPNNALSVWQMTDRGAFCTARIEPNGSTGRTASARRMAAEAAIDVPIRGQRGLHSMFSLKVLPGCRVLISNGKEVRLSDLADRHTDPKSLYGPQTNNSGSADIPIIRASPTGPALPPSTENPGSVGLLPDGRLVHVSEDGSIRAYSMDNPNGDKGVTLGNFFCGQESGIHQRHTSYPRSIKWMIAMHDGRLLAACETKATVRRRPKTLFFVYDPYNQARGSLGAPTQDARRAQPGISHNPVQEE